MYPGTDRGHYSGGGTEKMIPGFVCLSVTGEQRERFLNLCRGRGMELKRIVLIGEKELQVTMQVRDFFRIGPLRRKTGVHIHILKKRGPLFFLLWCRLHKRLMAGLVMMLLVICFLSTRLWSIQIQGNIMNPTSQLLEFLEDQGISYGMKKIHCHALAEAMRREFPEITWVSASLAGTKLSFEIREGNTPPEESEEDAACSLFSEIDGVVERMVTRKGTPLVRTGDTVEKGQELVSGILNIIDDSQEVVRYEYVHADADIYIRHKVSYYDSFSRNTEKKILKGKEKKYFFLRIKNLFLDLSWAKKKNEDRVRTEYPFQVTEHFYLPLSAGIITAQEYTLRKETLTEKDAKKQAIFRLHNYEEKLIQKGVQISENNVKIEINYQDCVSSGTLTVTEKTGREAPTEKKTQPKERTPEDG